MATPGPPAWFQKHCNELSAHGPLPVGIDVTANGNIPRYSVRISGNVRAFSHHPLSPSGRKEWGSLLDRAGEEKGRKAEAHGVAHPPIVYKPREWVWETHENMRHILIKAFQLSNLQVTMEDLGAKNAEAVDVLVRSHQDLYHPRDREELDPFNNEHSISCWARHFKRGLVVIAPEIGKGRENWATFKNATTATRPAVRARYSTGYQEDFPPIVLGALPTGKDKTKWFTLVPTEAMMGRFQDQWRGCNWSDVARNFKYTDTEKLIWAVVSIQRSIVLGAVSVPDEDLGDYIMQYGRYLAAKEGHGAVSFIFQKSTNTSFPKVTFHELTRWVLTSGEKSSTKRYAKAWDNAIRLNVVYRRSLHMSDWKNFVQAAAALQIKK